MLTYTVITICLNSEKTIRKAIDSVLIQNPLPAEYIFVDGGSSDATLEIIEKTQTRVKSEGLAIKIKLLNQTEKSGIYGAMNMGIESVSADLVFILNSDDWYEDGAAATVIQAFSSNKEVEVVYGQACFYPESGPRHVRNPRLMFLLPFLMPLAHPATIIKKSVYDKIGFYNEKYSLSADYDFVYRCYREGINFCEIRRPLANMLLGGAANTGREQARRETYEIGKRHCAIKLFPLLAFLARGLLRR